MTKITDSRTGSNWKAVTVRSFLVFFATLSLTFAFVGSLQGNDTAGFIGILGLVFTGCAGMLYMVAKDAL